MNVKLTDELRDEAFVRFACKDDEAGDLLVKAAAALEQAEKALTEIVDEGLACPRCDELGREALATLAGEHK